MTIKNKYNILEVNLNDLLLPVDARYKPKLAPFFWYAPFVLFEKSNQLISVVVRTIPIKKIVKENADDIQIAITPGFIEIDDIGEKKFITVVEYIEGGNKSCKEILSIYDLEITALKSGRSIIAISGDRICDSIIVDVINDNKSATVNKINPKEAFCCA